MRQALNMGTQVFGSVPISHNFRTETDAVSCRYGGQQKTGSNTSPSSPFVFTLGWRSEYPRIQRIDVVVNPRAREVSKVLSTLDTPFLLAQRAKDDFIVSGAFLIVKRTRKEMKS